MQVRQCAQPLSSWCVSLNAGDGSAARRWMSGQKVEHEGEDMPNFDIRLESGNVGESTIDRYGKTAKEAVNDMTRGAAYLANAAKRTVLGDGLANETQNPAGEVTATRRTGDKQSSADPIHRVRQYVASNESDDTRNPTERYPSMAEAAGRQSSHLRGTEGGDDKAYSQLAPQSGPHQDKSRSPPGPHDAAG